MPVYLDHAATTPLMPEVRNAYVHALETVGNPSSIHAHGQQARAVLEDARERVAHQLGCDSAEVVFTSGGTESINLGLKGLFWRRQREHERLVVFAAEGEHHATVEALDWLEDRGAQLRWLALDMNGQVHPEAFREVLRDQDPHEVALVTVMLANNEVGTIQPVAELASIAAEFGLPMHVDGVAGLGQLAVDFASLDIAALSLSAHKIGGPVGIGALILSRQWEVEPLLHGGDQQRGRSGTMDVAGAVAFATALEVSHAHRANHLEHLRALQTRLIAGIERAVPDAVLRGAPASEGRLPSNVHFTFPGCQGDSLLFLLDQRGFSVSTGSACHAGVAEVSHVLIAMGLDEETALGALRFTLGENNTAAQIDELLGILPELVATARQAGVNTVR